MISPQKSERQTIRSLRAGLLIGIGIMAALDEIIFHQLLSWHHFYDGTTPAISLLSDGLLHAAELIIIVAGFFMLADIQRQRALVPKRTWAGFFLGAGIFQLFDGIVDHKVLRLHQVRYGVGLLPYDILWNTAGATLLVVGWIIFRINQTNSSSDTLTT